MRTLTGSTLAETLVMMIVAGVIFLSVMDGLTLFTRLQTQRAAALVENGRASEGYYRLENLIADADSICDEAGGLVLFRSGQQGLLAIRDSILLYNAVSHGGEPIAVQRRKRTTRYGFRGRSYGKDGADDPCCHASGAQRKLSDGVEPNRGGIWVRRIN